MKLHVAAPDLPRIAVLPALRDPARDGEPATRHLRTVYYDTPDLRLFAAGIALRVRCEDGRFIQTLKTVNSATTGDSAAVAVRREWDWPVAGEAPDLAPLAAEGIAALVPAEARAGLVPIFVTDFRRTSWLVRPDSLSSIEIAVDDGEVAAGTACARISEVELELKSGRIGRLFELALALQDSVPVRIGTESKAEVGYRLVTGRLPAPVLPEPLGLSPVTTVAEAFRHIVRHGLRQLLANEACALADGDAEGLHQMRVALRRLRTALRLFRPVVGAPELDRLRGELRWFAEQLGAARGWDVLVSGTLAPLAGSPKAPPGLDALAAAARDARRAPAHEAMDAVLSPRCTGLLLALGAWLEDGRWHAGADPAVRAQLDRPVADPARGWLSALAEKARKAGKGIGKADAESRETLRRRLRKLHYAVEFFRGLYPSATMPAYVAALEAVLSALDADHDADVARALLHVLAKAHPEHAPAAEAVAARLLRKAEKRRKELPERWKAFREVGAFWEG